MFARVTSLEIDPLRIDTAAAVTLFRNAVLPELREQDGYAGVLVLATPEGRGLLVSLWDTEEHADASSPVGFYPEVLDRYMTIFAAPPGRERYEVAFAELPAEAAR